MLTSDLIANYVVMTKTSLFTLIFILYYNMIRDISSAYNFLMRAGHADSSLLRVGGDMITRSLQHTQRGVRF